jgi:tetratricopeptide (TPR) repeat protein
VILRSSRVAILTACLVVLGGQIAGGIGRQQSAPTFETVKRNALYCYPESYETARCGEGIRQLERVIGSDPTLVEAYLMLATSYWNRSMLEFNMADEARKALREKSVEMLRKAVEVDSKNVEALERLVLNTKDKEEKLTLASRLVAVAPHRPESHNRLAIVLLRAGQLDQAMAAERKALQLRTDMDRDMADSHRAFAHILKEEGHRKEAVEVYETILVMMEEQPRGARCAEASLHDPRRYQDFPEFVEKLEKLLPYCANLEHSIRAAVLRSQGKIEEAIQELESQLKANPHYVAAYIPLADLHRKQGDADKAREAVKKFLEMETDPPERCYQYVIMQRLKYQQFAPRLLTELQKECEERREANQ